MTIPVFLARLLIKSGLARYIPSVQRLCDGGTAYLRHYSDRVLAAPHGGLANAASLLEPPAADVLDLSLGAPRFDLLPSGGTKLPTDRRGWPHPLGSPELRAAVVERMLADHNIAVSPHDEVLITPGAAGAFSVALDTFINPGDRVVLFDPCSPLYPLALKQRQARIRWVGTRLDQGRLRVRFDHLEKALRRARMLVINSPSNPTGGLIASEDLEQIAWWAERNDVLIFSDEVFSPYRYEGDSVSIGSLPRAKRRTLTVGSVSKSHALASARVGWLAGYRHLVRPCAATAGLQAMWPATLCQQIALQALRQDTTAIRAEFDSRRKYAFERLQGMGLKPEWPAGGFFFWVPVGPEAASGRLFAEKLLRAKKVLVTPGELFGPSGAGHVRISYAAEDGRLREGLGRLADWLKQAQREEPSVTPQSLAA